MKFNKPIQWHDTRLNMFYSEPLPSVPTQEYIVALRSCAYPTDPVVLELVEARTENEAIARAFATRNIPDNWEVTDIWKDGPE